MLASADLYVGDVLSAVTVTGIYARLGELEKAIAGWTAFASQPAGPWTARGLAARSLLDGIGPCPDPIAIQFVVGRRLAAEKQLILPV